MNLDIEGARRFHGHSCPGLTIGIRAAELALREIGAHAVDEEVVDEDEIGGIGGCGGGVHGRMGAGG